MGIKVNVSLGSHIEHIGGGRRPTATRVDERDRASD